MPGRATSGPRSSPGTRRAGEPVSGPDATALPPWSATDGGIVLSVRLTPKGGRDAIDGIEVLADGRAVLKARVRTAPVEGAANAALLALIATIAGVSRSAVGFIAGETARIKRLRIAGDAKLLIAALEQAAARKIDAKRKAGA